jgi:hypothetical protein
MRDFRDAKAMAQTLRSTLGTQGHKITNSQSLELIAKAFGAADWNTLAAAIRDEPGAPSKAAPVQAVASVTDAIWDLPWSNELNAALQQALASAKQRRHQYATIEHLLLALIDEPDAASTMTACGADLGSLKQTLERYIDNELQHIVTDDGPVALPTAGFRRVIQRGRLHARQSGRTAVTGADFLLGVFSESLSPSARFLDAQNLTRESVAKHIKGGDGATA